jgi:dipeptidyl aminopeptidase/acylaminoacyl peptidase
MFAKKQIPLFQYFEENKEGKKLEALLVLPEKENNKNTLVVVIHGFNKFGAWEHLFQAERVRLQGYSVLLPSQFGFGKSTPPPDYCGPATVDAIADMIKQVTLEQGITHERVIVRGASRGAIIASLLAVRYPKIMAGTILEAGAYDFKKDYEWPHKNSEIKANVGKEMPITEESFHERSAYFFAEQIASPILLMHGKNDETISVEQAELFSRRLTELKKDHQLVILENKGHLLGGPDVERNYIFPFIEKCLQNSEKEASL